MEKEKQNQTKRTNSFKAFKYLNKVPIQKTPESERKSIFNASSSQSLSRLSFASMNTTMKFQKPDILHKCIQRNIQETQQAKRTSRIKLTQYLELMKKICINQKPSTSSSKFHTSPFPQTKIYQEAWIKLSISRPHKKRHANSLIPYKQTTLMVAKVYKHFDLILKLGYSYDHVVSIIRQMCSKNKGFQVLLLNKRQKPSRSYFAYDLKKEYQCVQAIIKQTIEFYNGKFDVILRDLNTLCIFLEDQVIERGRCRIKQIKKSIVHLKSQLEENYNSEEMGFNCFIGQKSSKQSSMSNINFVAMNKNIVKYMSPISRNINEQLVVAEDEIGEFLGKNRKFVQLLGKISQKINK